MQNDFVVLDEPEALIMLKQLAGKGDVKQELANIVGQAYRDRIVIPAMKTPYDEIGEIRA